MLRGDTPDGPLPPWIEDAQELVEIVAATGWDEPTINETPGVLLDQIRMVADVNKVIERERLIDGIARAIHGR